MNQHTHTSKITSKGQVTIPKKMREHLKLQEGEHIVWAEVRPGVLEVRRVEPSSPYLNALEQSLSAEWLSDEDEEAYGDL